MKTNLKLAHPPKTPELLAQDWLDAKAEENAAAPSALRSKKNCLRSCLAVKEGSQTIKLENGMRVVTEGRLTRSIDAKHWQDDWNDLPAIIQGYVPLEA